MIKNDSNFGSRLKRLREEAGLRQETVADALGISRPTLSHYEAGTRNPDTSTLRAICDYYSVSADWLLGRSECKAKSTESILAIETGLSEKAILVLKEIYNDYEGKVILPALNYLIEQETPEPNGWSAPYNIEEKEARLAEYYKAAIKWRDAGYLPVLRLIETFISYSAPMSMLLQDGTFEGYLENKRFYDIPQTREELSDMLLLDKIEHHLRILRQRKHHPTASEKDVTTDVEED